MCHQPDHGCCAFEAIQGSWSGPDGPRARERLHPGLHQRIEYPAVLTTVDEIDAFRRILVEVEELDRVVAARSRCSTSSVTTRGLHPPGGRMMTGTFPAGS